METTLDLTADMIDVRDIMTRVEELENDRDGYEPEALDAWRENYPGDEEELEALTAILEDLKGNGGDEQWRGDWYPDTLIRDTHFEAYMDDMLEDCGEIPKDLPPYLSITVDYNALQMDYTSTEIEGTDYWYR